MFDTITTIDSINVRELGQIEVRQAEKVLRDGVEIAKTYHRSVIVPGADLSGCDERVAAIAAAAWTPEIIAAFEASQNV